MEQQLMIWIGSLTGKSLFADLLASLFISTDFLKGAPFAMAIMLVWQKHKVDALRMLTVVVLSVLAARISQGFFYSPRPIMVSEIADHFSPMAKSFRLDWNSFPSDHMSLYFPIAVMTYWTFRRLGIFLMVWSILVVGLPRVFFGRHYPSDILGGIAVGSATLAFIWSMKSRFDPWLEKLAAKLEKRPELSTCIVFLFCFQIATVFDGIRHIMGTFKHLLMHYLVG